MTYNDHCGQNTDLETTVSRFIQRKFDVQDPELTARHRHGQAGHRAPVDLQSTNIFFIGPRGCGKSTLARAVAEHAGMMIVDTDDLIQDMQGQSIARIVEDQGWEAFREMEHEALLRVCQGTGQSVGTGGGVVLREENRQLLRSHGHVFYLLADAGILRQRLEAQKDASWRPPLSDLDADQEAGKILAQREPLYFQTLHYLLPADRPVQELVQDVLERLGHVQERA
jgi:shikimate kinase